MSCLADHIADAASPWDEVSLRTERFLFLKCFLPSDEQLSKRPITQEVGYGNAQRLRRQPDPSPPFRIFGNKRILSRFQGGLEPEQLEHRLLGGAKNQ
jgi:hypothetical protein